MVPKLLFLSCVLRYTLGSQIKWDTMTHFLTLIHARVLATPGREAHRCQAHHFESSELAPLRALYMSLGRAVAWHLLEHLLERQSKSISSSAN